MVIKFSGGFSTDKADMVPLPATFFRDVLPEITSMSELKVTLHVFWLLSQQQAFPRFIDLASLQSDTFFLEGLRTVRGPRPALEYLVEGLELAVARGTLLEIIVPGTGAQTTGKGNAGRHYYLVNTQRNRHFIAGLREGREDFALFARNSVEPQSRTPDEQIPRTVGQVNGGQAGNRSSGSSFSSGASIEEAQIEVPRPNIFGLYEQNIGMLTPLIAEQLSDAEETYPAEWINEAFNEAVSLNKRNWRYIQRTLENWAIRGKDDGKDRRYSNGPLDPDKYKKGKYAHLFRRK